MPLTKTEIFYFGLGISIGAVTGAHWKKIRPLLEPLLGSMSGGCRDAYGDLSALFAERFGEQSSVNSNGSVNSNDTHCTNVREKTTDLDTTCATIQPSVIARNTLAKSVRKTTIPRGRRMRPVYRKSRAHLFGMNSLTSMDICTEKNE